MKKLNHYIKDFIFRIWYWYISLKDKQAEVTFMNYGYDEPGLKLELSGEEETNRYSIQLYNHMMREIKTDQKKILEIGSGRGGGLSYLNKHYHFESALGVDLNQKAVDFCNNFYPMNGISFRQGNAQALDFASDSYDIILNVESSHRYTDIKAFFNEVYRVLKPGGYFLITDFRYNSEMDELKKEIREAGLIFITEKSITTNVVRALEMDNGRRIHLVKKLVPSIIQSIALNFAGAVGTDTYNNFKTGRYEYFSYILQKKQE
ncbi:MAG: class I SAM-dependent methyltransferase [Bacteroidales bacterium]